MIPKSQSSYMEKNRQGNHCGFGTSHNGQSGNEAKNKNVPLLDMGSKSILFGY